MILLSLLLLERVDDHHSVAVQRAHSLLSIQPRSRLDQHSLHADLAPPLGAQSEETPHSAGPFALHIRLVAFPELK
jgi:hypothetical protein